jgi:hypothetical protein
MTTMDLLDGEVTAVSRDDTLEGRPARFTPNAGILAAAFAVALGFGLIAFTWWKVSEFTNSAQQIPYLVSGGLTGLGLVVVGAALLVVVTRGNDDKVREQQAEALVRALSDLAESNRST